MIFLRQEKKENGERFPSFSVSVPRPGVEPGWILLHWCLRPARLPIPPSGHFFEMRCKDRKTRPYFQTNSGNIPETCRKRHKKNAKQKFFLLLCIFKLPTELFLTEEYVDRSARQFPTLTDFVLQETLVRFLHVLRQIRKENE